MFDLDEAIEFVRAALVFHPPGYSNHSTTLLAPFIADSSSNIASRLIWTSPSNSIKLHLHSDYSHRSASVNSSRHPYFSTALYSNIDDKTFSWLVLPVV
ncbi:hypothetical protein BDR03DRAFT_312119 [Suillus americanus]|nr:hypothetical protein BDR03DRAFT_312119 [Suillus americanus]